mmetsp:Transcript_24121/g.67964  ORF Transcript_24121/g.67964 Transcript_24121/m.67964 type:complete len:180 (+) Transcript_24121:81-620(+)|eukprot:CAMPEP_0119560154 /NCGR_PEP_ID=MMETSP1352-20130426/14160_1 /TAXON_ID=265584 /ORGANISM="Stauroneis constricta, Strain CCMP1120" /LENGTH=179 /DNA_ID=CAMNT_0007608067 /DNA_START=55 /DNA_END=594 /DNA_ORIENTATION=-
MVKHGRNKKRRAGRIGKTKLKNKNFRRWNPNPKITDKTIKKLWDPSKSPAVNMANMGLVGKPNEIGLNHNNNNSTSSDSTTTRMNVIELYDVPDSDGLGKKKKKRHLPLSESEQKYMAKCMAKYGDDYGKMFRDIKINNMQHTENQLRKMGSRFLLLDDDQLLVDVPGKVKTLMEVSSS